MASLWNVNDASTADFMAHFYAALGSGQPIDEAARAAKLAFLNAGGRLRHPYFWGPFVVTGNARAPVQVARPRLRVLAAAVAVGALACFGLFGLTRRRRVR
jgi:hypothetical protein